MEIKKRQELSEIARKIRVGIVESTNAAGCGHPGGSLSIADVLAWLYFGGEMNIDPKDRGDTLEFTRSSWRKEEDYEAFLNDMRKRSLYDTGVNVTAKDRILTLVTCDTRDNSKRIVVIAKETSREGR